MGTEEESETGEQNAGGNGVATSVFRKGGPVLTMCEGEPSRQLEVDSITLFYRRRSWAQKFILFVQDRRAS